MSLATKALAEMRVAMNPGVPVVDVALWAGAYPFRGIANVSVEDLESKLITLNVSHGIISPLEGIFWENNLDAYDRLADEVAGGQTLDVWPVVRPGGMRGLERLLDRYRPKGIRLTPNYHGYRLSDAPVEAIFRLAKERDLVVQIFQRIADERWHYLMKVPGVEVVDLEYATSVYGDVRMILSGVQPVGSIAHRLKECANVWADVSRVRGPVFGMEELVQGGLGEKLVFGSLWPLQIIEATLWQVTTARLEDESKAKLLAGNAKKLLGL